MKLCNLFETPDEDHEILMWFRDHITTSKSFGKMYDIDKLTVKNGEVSYSGVLLNLTCDELKYPLVKADVVSMEELKSVKNFPTKPGVNQLALGGCSIKKIDHPITCNTLSIAKNQLTSLKDIHKFVSCRDLLIWNNPIKDSILGLLLIPGIKNIDDGSNGALMDEFEIPNKAIAIVSKYVGKGKSGMIEAQQELLDNDLDDYAEI